jgi:formate dehydrogenase subunit delta
MSTTHAVDPAEKLGRLANQIATFFRSYPDAEAIAGIHDHIVSFWSPTMRRDILARADRDTAGLDPLVVAALHAITTGKSPAFREAAGPDEVGQIGASDAG